MSKWRVKKLSSTLPDEYYNKIFELGIHPYFMVESGSRTYGFASPASDWDVRGVFTKDGRKWAGLYPGKDVVNGFAFNKQLDWQFFEIRKFLRLLTKPNLNVMEWVYTPHKYEDHMFKEFKSIADKCWCTKLGAHARGWAYSIYNMDWNEPKKCLYAIRPLMLYINLIENREFVSDITILAKHLNLEEHVAQLIELNRMGSRVPDRLKDINHKYYLKMSNYTEELEEDCWLPDQPNEEAITEAESVLYFERRISLADD